MLGKRPETFEKMHVVKVFRGIESSMSVISLKFISRTNVFVNVSWGEKERLTTSNMAHTGITF